MPSGVGDVLGKLGDEVQGVEDLEVACDPRTAAEEIGARRPGEASAGFLFGEVDHGALPGDSGSGAARQVPEADRTLFRRRHEAATSAGRPPRTTQNRPPRIKAPISGSLLDSEMIST